MIVIVMGVSGSGKTTIGKLLAQRLGAHFLDADDFHPEENIAKMRSGVALEDADRAPWLSQLNKELRQRDVQGASAILACSALKRSYRQTLTEGLPEARIVYLRGSRALLASRLERRRGHFMTAKLLDSQFAALEEPRTAITINVDGTPEDTADAIVRELCDRKRP